MVSRNQDSRQGLQNTSSQVGGDRGREQGQGHRCKWLLLRTDSERLPHGLDFFIELVTVPGGPALCWALGAQPGEGHSPVHQEASQNPAL